MEVGYAAFTEEKALHISAGHAASALHTMTLQVFQTRLKSLDEEGQDPESLRKLRMAADLTVCSKEGCPGSRAQHGQPGSAAAHAHRNVQLRQIAAAQHPSKPYGVFDAVGVFLEKFAQVEKNLR